MDEKVYQQEVVPDNPFPGEPQPIVSTSQPNPVGTFTPTTTKEKPFKKKRVATELLSTALNTRSKKILQEFELTDSGGFKVGKFENGISGDLRITPNGLTARNISGIITFAIDGDTGEAFFLGTVRAGSLISDAEIQGGSININDVFTVDENGNMVASSATLSGYLAVGEAEGDITTMNGSKITTNTLDADRIKASNIDVAVDVGTGAASSYVRLDGPNNRIVVHDGTNPRIAIGNV